MPIPISCPRCGEIQFLADDFVDWTVECTGCDSILRVPRQDNSDSVPAPAPETEPARVDLHTQNPFADTAVATAQTAETQNPYQASSLPAAAKVALPGRRKFYGPDPRSASRWKRLAGSFIDGLLLFFLPFLVGDLLAFGIRGEASFDNGDPFRIGGVGLMLLVHTILVSVRGQSIGKFLLGMQIRRTDDDNLPGFLHGILLRAFLPSVVAWLPGLGVIFTFVNPLFIFGEDKQCLHDKFARTKVLDLKAMQAYEARYGDQPSIWERR